MVRKSVYGVFLIFVILISNGYAEEKEEVKEENTKNDDKTISKRGILHFGIHGHPHVHAHTHAVPIVPKIPVITKVPTIIKPIIPAVLPAPVIPTTPYHLTHGGAVVTSYNANYPRVPVFTKTVIPPAYPFLPAIPHHHHHSLVPHHHHHGLVPHHHHHHHGLFPHHHGHHHGIDLHHGFDHHHHHLAGLFPHHHHHHSLYPHHHHHSAYPFDHHHHHNSFLPHHHHHHSLLPHHHHHHADFPHVHVHKPIVPVAVPEIHHPKIPVFFPSKPVFSKPEFNPTFVPIPVPTNPQPNPTVITVNPGISSSSSHNNNHINLYPTTQQTPIQPFTNHHHDHHRQNSQGNWQPILKPTQPTVTENCITYNYHAALKSSSSTTSNNVPQTNNFVSGQGPSMAQQLALYQQQQILHDQQNSFPYPAAETFSQNYEAPSNNGNYHGLSSYQVPLGVQ